MSWTSPVFTLSNPSPKLRNLKDFQRIHLPFLIFASFHGIYCFSSSGTCYTKLLHFANHIFQILVIIVNFYGAYYYLKPTFGISDIWRNQKLYIILNSTWVIGLCIGLCTFYYACNGFPWSKNASAVTEFQQLWASIKLPIHQAKKCEKYLQKMHFVVFVTTVIHMVTAFIVSNRFTTTLEKPKSFEDIVQHIGFACWFWCGGYLLIFCISIRSIFAVANTIISSIQNIQASDMDEFAILHQQATEMCIIFSKSYGLYYLFTLICVLFELCIHLDTLFNDNLDPLLRLEITILAILTMACVFLIWHTAASVNNEAHKPYSIINQLGCRDLKNLDPLLLKLVSFQQHRLGNDTIGIEIPGFGVVKSETLGTILSVFCTYLFLLVQFHSEANKNSVHT